VKFKTLLFLCALISIPISHATAMNIMQQQTEDDEPANKFTADPLIPYLQYADIYQSLEDWLALFILHGEHYLTTLLPDHNLCDILRLGRLDSLISQTPNIFERPSVYTTQQRPTIEFNTVLQQVTNLLPQQERSSLQKNIENAVIMQQTISTLHHGKLFWSFTKKDIDAFVRVAQYLHQVNCFSTSTPFCKPHPQRIHDVSARFLQHIEYPIEEKQATTTVITHMAQAVGSAFIMNDYKHQKLRILLLLHCGTVIKNLSKCCVAQRKRQIRQRRYSQHKPQQRVKSAFGQPSKTTELKNLILHAIEALFLHHSLKNSPPPGDISSPRRIPNKVLMQEVLEKINRP